MVDALIAASINSKRVGLHIKDALVSVGYKSGRLKMYPVKCTKNTDNSF